MKNSAVKSQVYIFFKLCKLPNFTSDKFKIHSHLPRAPKFNYSTNKNQIWPNSLFFSKTTEKFKFFSILSNLQAVAALRLFPHDIQDGIDQFRALGVVSLGPVISGAALTKNKVIRSKNLPERPRSHGVHGSGLQIHKDRPGHEFSPRRLIVVHVDALELEIRIAVIGPAGIDPVLVRNHLPKLLPRKNNEKLGYRLSYARLFIFLRISTDVNFFFFLFPSCSIKRLQWKKKINKKERNYIFTLAPIWLPHWPAWRCTISRIIYRARKKSNLFFIM